MTWTAWKCVESCVVIKYIWDKTKISFQIQKLTTHFYVYLYQVNWKLRNSSNKSRAAVLDYTVWSSTQFISYHYAITLFSVKWNMTPFIFPTYSAIWDVPSCSKLQYSYQNELTKGFYVLSFHYAISLFSVKWNMTPFILPLILPSGMFLNVANYNIATIMC